MFKHIAMKIPLNIYFIFFSVAVFFLTSCKKPDIVKDSELITYLYNNSNDTLIIQDNRYILETSLYRDFFPEGRIPRETPLIADIYLVNLDSLPVFEQIEIIKLYIINNSQVYISSPEEGVQPGVPDFKLNKISRDGPEWGPDIYVDVFIEINIKLTNTHYLLAAKDQYIEKLE